MEQPTPKETLTSVKSLADKVQRLLVDCYGLEPDRLPQASGYIWDEPLEKLEEGLGQKLKPESRSAVFSWQKKGKINSIIYLDPEIQQQLAEASPQSLLEGDHLSAFSDLIEEVSHFVYQYWYFQKFGEKAGSPNVELQAVLDRYLIPHQMAEQSLARGLTPKTEQQILEQNESVHKADSFKEARPVAYVLGHEGGEHLINLLSDIFSQEMDPAGFLSRFYQADERGRWQFLLEDLGLKIRFIKHTEVEAAQEYLSQFDLALSEDNIIRTSAQY